MTRSRSDPTSMYYWYPRVDAAGVLTPKTYLLQFDPGVGLLEGGTPSIGYRKFLRKVQELVKDGIGVPFFLRTGHGSGKHRWRNTCFVAKDDLVTISNHVMALVEWSNLVDIMGLPCDVWAIRKFVGLRHSFTAFDGLPISREFRAFFAGGDVSCIHPYWPEDAVEEGDPHPNKGWRKVLRGWSHLSHEEEKYLRSLAHKAMKFLKGSWSLDFAQSSEGHWYLIDIAPAEKSFHWVGCPNG